MKTTKIIGLVMLIVILFVMARSASADIIVDNDGPGTSSTGGWYVSGAPNAYGTNSVYGSGGASYTWQIGISQSGTYNVYAWWTAFSNRSTGAPFTVNYSGGSQTVSVNQQLNGGQWNLLGTFTFDSSSGATIVLNTPSDYPTTFSADAIKLSPVNVTPPPAPAEVIVDNGGAGTFFTGEWYVSGAANAYGTSSIYGSGGVSYSWQAPLATGTYNVYAWWTAFSNRSTSAPYTINYTGASHTVSVNQQINGGQWNLLGTFSFDGSTPATVTLNTPSNYPTTFSADAIKFTPVTAPPPPPPSTEVIIDNGDPGTAYTGAWYVSGAANAYDTNSLYGSAGAAYTWQTTLSGEYNVYAWWTAFSNRSTTAPYTIDYSGGSQTVSVNQQINGGQWNLLGTFTFDSTSAAMVTLNTPSSYPTTFSADAIKFTPTTAPPPPPPPSSAGTVIDNGDPGTSYTGGWYVSGALFPYGMNSVYGSSGASYTWQTTLDTGAYDVYAWWTEFSNRSTAAPYTVNYSGGSQTVSVNQQINGGQWNLLGTFDFDSSLPAQVTLNTPLPYPATYSADAIKFLLHTDSPPPPTTTEEHIFACFGYGPYYSYEGYPDQYFIWQIENMGAYNIGGNVWLYQTASKTYYIHVVTDMTGTIQGLETPGATVLIYGHSNYGLGPVFANRDETLAQVITDVNYVDDPRILNISSEMVGAEVYELINTQAYPNWWTNYQDGSTAIMPYVFGDPRGDPPYNYYITYQVPGDPTYYKIETVQNSALQRFPDSGVAGWYSSSGALPNPASNPQYYITNPNGNIASATPHYDSRTIVKKKALQVSEQDMQYSRLFYLACFSGIYFTDTLKRGVMFYTLNNMSLDGGDTFFQYVKAYTEGKSDYEIWQMLQGMQAIFDYYDFNKSPGQ